jgi:uncharacterized protein
MLKENPFIHLFRTPGGYYIYDVNCNSIIKVSQKIYEFFSSGIDDSMLSDEEKRIIDKMYSDGFLSSRRITEIVHPQDEVLEYHLERKINMITLQVTQNCNLRCEYCVYSGNYENRGHSGKRMTFETAKKGIDFLISHSSDRNRIALGFYGGEPLIEFELIKKCIEYAEEKAEGKDIIFSLTNNGTLLTDEMIEYFQKHNVSLAISIDGPKEIHDKNRKFASDGSGTFKTIYNNIMHFKKKYPEYSKKILFNMVIDRENDFSCINKYISNDEIFNDSMVNAANLSDFYSKVEIKTSEDFLKNSNYERFKMYLSKLGRLDDSFVSKIVSGEYDNIKRKIDPHRPVQKGLPEKYHHGGPCIPGVQRLFLNANGNFYPCERVSETSEMMKMGNIEEGFDFEKARKILNIGKVNEKSCINCWAIRQCGLCAAAADDLTSFSKDKKNSRCGSQRATTEDVLKNYCMLKEYGHDFDVAGITMVDYV